jgi:ribosomal protein S18 acetylase RimI-like enzyme
MTAPEKLLAPDASGRGYACLVTSRWSVSPALPADYPAFARLVPELGVPDPTPSPERFARMIAPHALVLRDGDEVLGYLWARPRGGRMHVVHVITDPAHRGRGVGRALMAATADRSRAAGFRRWMLNVKPENAAARALYERCGMHVAFASVSMRIAWIDVPRMPAPAGIAVHMLAPADDARFEDALALLPGEIASQRALEGRVLVGAEDATGPVGIAVFDPSYPGAGLFRVRAPEHARALLDGIRPYALPAHDHLHLLVEGDPVLEAVLTAAGAETVMHMLRMEGEIPDRP